MEAILEVAPPVKLKAAHPAAAPARVNVARFVTIALASVTTGLTEAAIRRKIQRGVWLEGRHWRKRDGGIFIDMDAYQRWVEKEPA